MDIITIFALAVALAMDAFAVSIASGIRLGRAVNAGHTIRLASAFGFFQFGMTALGWLAGAGMESFMRAADHWIAMGLLGFIGGKMIWESFRGEEVPACGDPTKGWTVLALAVATSIDAFAVGLSLGLLQAAILLPSVIIGLVAAGFTAAGIRMGNMAGAMFGRRVEIVGGAILIGIGVRIFVQHLTGGM